MINAFSTGLHFPLQKQNTHTQGLIYAHCMSSSCHSSQDFFCAPTLQRAQIAPHRGLRNCQFTSHWVHKTVPDPRTNSYTLWEGRKLWELLRGWARENQQIYFVFNFSASAAHIAFQFMHVFRKQDTNWTFCLLNFRLSMSSSSKHAYEVISPDYQFHCVVCCMKCDINKDSSSSMMEFQGLNSISVIIFPHPSSFCVHLLENTATHALFD